MSPVAQNVIRRLDAVRQQWWLFSLMTTVVWGCLISASTLLAFILADALFRFPQGVLLTILLAWLTITAGVFAWVVRRVGRFHRSLEATARRIEEEFPELGSNLINALQLAFDTKNVNRDFCEAAIADAAARLSPVHLEEAAYRETRWRRFLYCMNTPRDFGEALLLFGCVLALGIACHLLLPTWGSAVNRLMQPWEYVPVLGSVKILQVLPGDSEVLLGSSATIVVEILDSAGEEPPRGSIWVQAEGEAGQWLPMAPGEMYEVADSSGHKQGRRKYQFVIPTVLKPLEYRVEIGDSQSRIYRLTVREKPTVSEVEVTLNFPAYMNRSPQTFVQQEADLEAPQYTVAELRIRATSPIAKGHLEVGGEAYAGRVEHHDRVLRVNLPLLRDGTFTIHLFNAAGHTDPNPRVNRIKVIPDSPPRVELIAPPRQVTAAPRATMLATVRVADDYGVGRVRLEMKIRKQGAENPGDAGSEERASLLHEWTNVPGNTAAALQHSFAIPAEGLEAGDVVLVRAVAWDKRFVKDWGLDLRPQESASAWHEIRIVDAEKQKQEKLAELTNLRTQIYRLLEKQIRANVSAVRIATGKSLEDCVRQSQSVRDQQVDVQKSCLGVIKSIPPTAGEAEQLTKRVLNQLAFGEMLEAVSRCDDLTKLKAWEAFAEPVAELSRLQQRIIDSLRKLLDGIRHAEAEVVGEIDRRAVGDLPDEARKKFEDLQSKLEAALEAQKKVIEAAENLAKAPVEDFAEAQEQLVKALEAAEDDWSRFLTELNMDLSKLPEQDFANPSLLKELIEIQTEIKMAEDALLKKTVDIAVPLEQLGYEMAEELKTNFEKWLPDTPDRERWSQEESLTDADKEAPMAELPGELEDLIGELMEEEEALFDEMEDVSSSAADSLDAGAGWDALDGPISNMSAKGVTGNRLPNTNEIGGRSGEGRQGKSSGEFVGEEAVGKGGRRTPSRLTPDPYMQGQIKDHSRDPVGGATGGGKESGEGGAGLEGPAPADRDQRERNRLAGKQAALRNKAEGIDLQFQIMNFHRTDLRKLIELMAQIEQDVRAGRYQNALRQRQIMLEGLKNVQDYVSGEFQIRRDTSLNLPADIQKELLGSMQEPSPVGWEELNRQYFERLATSGQSQ